VDEPLRDAIVHRIEGPAIGAALLARLWPCG
jgi:hypothetical protein